MNTTKHPSLRLLFSLLLSFLFVLTKASSIFAQGGGKLEQTDGLTDTARAQISALLFEKESRTPAQQKIDSQLLYAAKMRAGQPIAEGVAKLDVSLEDQNAKGDSKLSLVLVDVKIRDGGAAHKEIEQAGGTIVNFVPGFGELRARVRFESLEAIAQSPDVRFIYPAAKAELDTGSVNSEGDRTLAADSARAAYALNTGSVRIGVLSDSASVTGINNSVANGNLAAGQVTVVPGQNGSGSDEGLAMLEIINDICPGVRLYFATANSTPAQFAANILALRNAPYNCDIIVDDIRYGNEAPFQDSVIARAVNTVTASGALYFASAGNSGNKTDGTSGTWVGDFVNGGAFTVPGNGTAYEVHSFQTSPSVQNYNLVVAGGSSYALSLFWADPEGGSSNDYDVFQLNSTGTSVTSSSTNLQTGTQDPYETTSLSSAGGNRVVVVRKIGAAARALYVTTGRGRLSINTDGFARGHSAAPDAYATAAVPASVAFSSGQPTGPYPNSYSASQQTETFSSDGPARKFFNPDGSPVTPGNFLIGTGGGLVQQYPIVTAPDGVSTSVSGFAPFFGTSAAAPHAAAVAGLLKARQSTLTPAQIRTILTSTALDIETAGVDRDTGAGILQPVAALGNVSPGAALIYSANSTSGGNGNGGVDFNETNNLSVAINNVGSTLAVNVSGRLATTTPGVTINTATASYGSINGGATATNSTPFVFTTAPNFQVGTPIDFYLTITSGRKAYTFSFRTPTGSGVGAAQRFDFTGSPVTIPTTPATVNAPITVSGFTGIPGKVVVSFYVTHTYDSDLTFILIAPDGTQQTLFSGVGGNGDNFGSAASPDSSRCTLDDGAATLISANSPPFVGTFRPVNALAKFNGLPNATANGTWTLRVVDGFNQDGGAINAVSLFISPVTGVDGGNP